MQQRKAIWAATVTALAGLAIALIGGAALAVKVARFVFFVLAGVFIVAPLAALNRRLHAPRPVSKLRAGARPTLIA